LPQNALPMGANAVLVLLADVISGIQKFVWVFVLVYGLIIFAYILMSWIRMPYSVWMSRIQGFLRDVCEPYLSLFRRVLPPLGPLDLSPMVALFALYLLGRLVVYLLGRLH
jgi:YggT family protein